MPITQSYSITKHRPIKYGDIDDRSKYQHRTKIVQKLHNDLSSFEAVH